MGGACRACAMGCAVARGVSGADPGFRVGWHTTGRGLISVFEEFCSSVGKASIFGEGGGSGWVLGAGRWAIIL